MANYLDKDGVLYLWGKVKALFNKGITGLSVSGRTITYTKGDGTTGTITTQDTNTTYGIATTTSNGLMSSSDKTKLNGIENGANKTIVDGTLSDTSTNPVQNKIVKTEIDIVKNLANQTNIQVGEVASAIMYGALPKDAGFIHKDTGGTSYGLFNDLTNFVDL